MKQKLFTLSRFLVSGLPVVAGAIGIASAQSVSPAPSIINNTSDIFSGLLCPIINTMFFILIGLAVIMVMWAAYTYLTAGDDTEKVHRATKTITYAAVAVVVALLAKGFPILVSSIFGSYTMPSCSAT